MITILSNILLSNGYKLVDLDFQQDVAEIYLFQPLDEVDREEYFVTIKLHIQSDDAAKNFLEVKSEELFEKISNSGRVDSSFEKNCTILLCHEEDNISRQTVLEIEENQYNFKKNVIAYSQKELSAMEYYLASNQVDRITNSVVNRIINSDGGKDFLAFKNNNKQQKDHYSLMLKTVLKLPFITYTPQEKQLINLSLDIENSFSQNSFRFIVNW